MMPLKLKKIPIYKSEGHGNFEAMRFCFGHVALTVIGRMTGSLWRFDSGWCWNYARFWQ